MNRIAVFLGVLSILGLTPVFAQEAYFYSGGKRWPLASTDTFVSIQSATVKDLEGAKRTFRGQEGEINWNSFRALPDNSVAILPLAHPGSSNARRLASVLRQYGAVQRVLQSFGSLQAPSIVTADFVLQFSSPRSPGELQAFARKYGIEFVKPLGGYAPNGYLCRILDPRTQSALQIANTIYEQEAVRFSHPDFISPKALRFVPNDPLFPDQWHLNNTGQAGGTVNADINAPEAWDVTRGSRTITIAIVDEGVDIDHEDFQADGKIVEGFNSADGTNDPRPNAGQHHGTAVSGLATANANNGLGVCGVAPECRLMAVKIGATPSTEASSIDFAARHGADVISNSWGPPDGLNIIQPLPDVVRTALDYAADQGRGGKGCVIFWAAGNGNESADKDGYASYSKVISVAASNDDDRRSRYSDFGNSVDLSAPSDDDTWKPHAAITTTDRMGSVGYSFGNYTSTFGGTSASAPIAAGVAALMLSVNPGMTRQQVQLILQNTADKIDQTNGSYDSNGHSRYYGYGRVNALAALQATLGSVAPTVSRIDPSSGVNTGTVNATITGSSLVTGASVRLTKTGQSDIVGSSVNVVDSTQMTCSLNLSGRATGAWNVVVTNPNNESGSKQNGFTITGVTFHNLELTALSVSPNPVRRGAKATFAYTVKNTGTFTEKGVKFRLVYNGKVLGLPKSVGTLAPGQQVSGTMVIGASLAKGNYFITGEVPAVTQEINLNDNKQTVLLTIQ